MSLNFSAFTVLIARAQLAKHCVKAVILSAAMANGPAFAQDQPLPTVLQPTKHNPGNTNIAPVAVTDYVNLAQASQAINVLANDKDANRDTLTVMDASAEFGAVAFTSDGLVAYAANDAQAKADVIHYVLTDGRGGIARGKVIVKIQ